MWSYVSGLVWGPDIEKKFRKRLVRRLNREAIDCEWLFQKLQDTGSVIAGSYPLQVLLKEKWEDSDLDIFCNNQEMMIGFNEFYKAYPLTPVKKTGYCLLFDQVVEYKTPTGFRIQVIYSKSLKSVTRDVFKRFDLDFCKVGFDGRQLLVDVPESIESRSCVYNYNKYAADLKNYERMLKYEKRGFGVNNREEFMDYLVRKGQEAVSELEELKTQFENEKKQWFNVINKKQQKIEKIKKKLQATSKEIEIAKKLEQQAVKAVEFHQEKIKKLEESRKMAMAPTDAWRKDARFMFNEVADLSSDRSDCEEPPLLDEEHESVDYWVKRFPRLKKLVHKAKKKYELIDDVPELEDVDDSMPELEDVDDSMPVIKVEYFSDTSSDDYSSYGSESSSDHDDYYYYEYYYEYGSSEDDPSEDDPSDDDPSDESDSDDSSDDWLTMV